MTLKIGLTGGIGSGKTIIAAMFEETGIPVYNADNRAKALMKESHTIKNEIIRLLGSKSYFNDEPDRKFIAEQVFTQPVLLQGLNKIIHPAVEKDFKAFVDAQSNSVPYIIKEAAILFESGTNKQLDAVILVKAPENIRISRVIARDNTSFEQVKARIDNQWPTEKTEQLADFIIDNSGKKLILPQLLEIDKTIRSRWQNMVNG